MDAVERIYDMRLDANYRRTRKKPFKGTVKVYCVAEDDEDREHVLHFQTDDLTIDVDTDFESIYVNINSLPYITRHKVNIGELKQLDDNGALFRVENFLNEEVYDEPTYMEDDYDR